jgi:hypothetical protein
LGGPHSQACGRLRSGGLRWDGDEPTGGGAETVIEEEAQQRAEEIGLRLSDFPSGWRAQAAEEDEEGQERFRKCVGTNLSEFTVAGHATSDDFVRGDATEASSEVVVLADEEQADRSLDVLVGQMRSERLNDCVRDAYEQGDNEGVELIEISTGELSFPDLAAESSAWQIELTVEADDVEVSAYLDIVFLREDRAIAQLMFLDVLTPFPDDEKEDLAGKVAERMQP